jgi:hypothetical protein
VRPKNPSSKYGFARDSCGDRKNIPKQNANAIAIRGRRGSDLLQN